MSIREINQTLAAISLEKFDALHGYIEALTNRYQVDIVIADILGISHIDPKLSEIIHKYSYHNNGFCNYVKKNLKAFDRCIENKDHVMNCFNKRSGAFYGRCHMGIEELVYPVKWKGQLIAMIFVGLFAQNQERSLQLLKKRTEQYGLNGKQCEERFNHQVRPLNFSIEALNHDVGILCQYLHQLCANYFIQGQLIKDKDYAIQQAADLHRKSFLVTQTVQFISQNFKRDISLRILADFCHCNPTYLSYIFKEELKVNIIDYLNEVRIREAKHMLDTSNQTITQIALTIGFNDPSYFTRVFKQFTGFSPKEYRKRECS